MHPDLDTRLFIGGGTGSNTGGAYLETRTDESRVGWPLYNWLSPGAAMAAGPQAHIFFVGV